MEELGLIDATFLIHKSYQQPHHDYPLMSCPFKGRKMLCASPNFLRRAKNLFTYCASHKPFEPDKKMICIQ